MEPYPPTLDVRFEKDSTVEKVNDKYRLNITKFCTFLTSYVLIIYTLDGNA